MSSGNISSSSLFHFTRKLTTLEAILKSGVVLAPYCTEHCWDNYKFALPMACFCDIPLSQILEHVSKYGSYGIGFKSSWSVTAKLTSAIYVRPKSSMVTEVGKALKAYNNEDFTCSFTDLFLLSHLKKYRGAFIREFKQVHKKRIAGNVVGGNGMSIVCFYKEREWRFVPPNLSKEEIKVERELGRSAIQVNECENKKYSVGFQLSDVNYLIIRSENERMGMIDFIERQLSRKNKYERELLKSKILSVEQISKDF